MFLVEKYTVAAAPSCYIWVQEYRSMKDKTIHHPYVSWGSDEQRSMFGLPDWSLMGGFSSSGYIMLTRDNQHLGGGNSHHGNQLLVCIHNKVCTPPPPPPPQQVWYL